MTQQNYARVILFKEDDTFIAQCLEYDIMAHGSSEKSAINRFEAVFNFERNLSIERGGSPFANIPKAPEEFFKMWEQCKENPPKDLTFSSTQLSVASCMAA